MPRLRPLLLGALAATVAAAAAAQSQAPGAISTRRPPAAAAKAAKPVKPDPDLLDGSSYEAEKRPLYGMISDLELPGSEQKSEQVGGSPEPAGTPGAPPPPTPLAGGAPPPPLPTGGEPPPPIASGQDDRQEPAPEGPQAQAGGIQAQKLEGPQSAGGDEQAKPRDMRIGDASLQIQTAPQNAQQVVGTEQPTSTQQYEKKVPAGQQTDNRNRGVERGKVMPKGI